MSAIFYTQLFLYYSLIKLEASESETAKDNDVWNENLELLSYKRHLEASDTETAKNNAMIFGIKFKNFSLFICFQNFFFFAKKLFRGF